MTKTVRAILLIVSGTCLPSDSSSQDFGRLDTGFEIFVTKRAEFPPGFEAELVTTETYPCIGYVIRSGVSWRIDTLTIHIGGFVRPSPCVSSMSLATGTTYLGNIGEGMYIFRINYRGQRDLHRVSITSNGVIVEAIENSFTNIEWE